MSKRFEKLENIPNRISQTTTPQKDPNEELNKLKAELSGGEALIWAEKKGIKWGQNKGDEI